MGAEPITPDTTTQVQACSLRYLAHAQPERRQGPVILYAQRNDAGLSLFVRRGLKQLVSEQHQLYFDELLRDLRHRCRIDPQELFQQLCNLSVGPLITDERYFDNLERPYSNEDFIELTNDEKDLLDKTLVAES